jgi:hypothetical protein
MKIIKNNKATSENLELLNNLVNTHLEPLLADRIKNKQKILEISHVGKFLMILDDKIVIDRISEKPDFILKNGQNIFGLEHQIVVDKTSKEQEGFFENIFSHAAAELKNDNQLPNFLANCDIIPNVNFQLEEKQKLISTIVEVVKTYVLNDKLIENPIIERILVMPHSDINLTGYLGPWWQKYLTAGILTDAIRKKEKLISKYKMNSGETQWLLLVIGGSGASSYLMNMDLESSFETNFDKIYVLEDFHNKLYEIK